MVVTTLNPEESLEEEKKDLLNEILTSDSEFEREAEMRQLTEWLLYEMSWKINYVYEINTFEYFFPKWST